MNVHIHSNDHKLVNASNLKCIYFTNCVTKCQNQIVFYVCTVVLRNIVCFLRKSLLPSFSLSPITFFDFFELWLTHTFIYYSSLRIIIYYKCVFGVLCSSRHEKCVDNWRNDEAWSYLKDLKHNKISWMVSWKTFVKLQN